MAEDGTAPDEGEEPDAMQTLAEVCAHAEVAIAFVASLTTNTTSEMKEAVGGEGVMLPIVLMLVSLVFAVRGGKLIRPSCVVASAAIGFWAVWDMLHMFVGMAQGGDDASGLPCEARLIGGTAVGLILGVVAFCVIKLGLFLLGACALGGSVYLFFEAFPHLDSGPAFVGPGDLDTGRSLLVWGIALLAGLVGGCLVRCNSKKVLEVVTAVIGGFGFAHAVHGLAAVGGGEMPGPAYLAVAIAIALPGWRLQRRARLKAKEPRRERESNTRNSSRGSKRSRRSRTASTTGLPDEARVVHEEGL